MEFFVQDLTGFTVATVGAAILLVLPGFGLLRVLQTTSKSPLPTAYAWLLALILLPPVDAVVMRYLGLPAAIVLHLALALAGGSAAFRATRSAPRSLIGIAVLWWVVIAYANFDIDWAARLHQSLTVLDTVKHAAVIRSIATSGLPLQDLFVARPGIAGYYYYFYIAPALVVRVCAPLVEARHAFMAASFAAGPAFVALVTLLAQRTGLTARSTIPTTLIVIGLAALSGLDLIAGLAQTCWTGIYLAQLDWWGDEVRWAATTLIWAPHHLSALIAVFAALLLIDDASIGLRTRTVATGLALAAAFGMSTWIAVGAVPVLGLWWIAERGRTDAARWWLLPAAAAVAGVVALPQIADLVAGRTLDGFPLGLHLRNFYGGPDFDWKVRLALMPLGYFLDFGIFAVGSLAFFASGGWQRTRATPLGRLLVVGWLVAIVLVSTVRSVIIFNDFGWRVIWFAQLPMMIWTIAALTEGRAKPGWRGPLALAAVLGALASIWDLAGLRFIRQPYFNAEFASINGWPDINYDQRRLYTLLAERLPTTAVVQHNPARTVRSFDFGLYGHQRVAVADSQAFLLGSSRDEVAKRVSGIAPLFVAAMPGPERLARARALGIDALMFNRMDPAWREAKTLCSIRFATACVAFVPAEVGR